MLLKARPYVKGYNGQTKWMYFLIEDDDSLEKYNTIQDKVSPDIEKEFHIETVYNKKPLKTKIKCYRDEAKNFHDKEIPMSTLIIFVQQ